MIARRAPVLLDDLLARHARRCAVRTASSPIGFSNLKMTMVPPEKSMPSGRPRCTIEPDAGEDDQRGQAMACQRHWMKS